MSRKHLFSFDGVRGLKDMRKSRREAKRLAHLLGNLTQAQLEMSLANMADERMRAAAFALWRAHLPFEAEDDTLARAHELRLASIREQLEAEQQAVLDATRQPLEAAQPLEVDEVICDACSAYALLCGAAEGFSVYHPDGFHPPGALIASSVLANPGVPYLVFTPPGAQEVVELVDDGEVLQ